MKKDTDNGVYQDNDDNGKRGAHNNSNLYSYEEEESYLNPSNASKLGPEGGYDNDDIKSEYGNGNTVNNNMFVA